MNTIRPLCHGNESWQLLDAQQLVDAYEKGQLQSSSHMAYFS